MGNKHIKQKLKKTLKRILLWFCDCLTAWVRRGLVIREEH